MKQGVGRIHRFNDVSRPGYSKEEGANHYVSYSLHPIEERFQTHSPSTALLLSLSHSLLPHLLPASPEQRPLQSGKFELNLLLAPALRPGQQSLPPTDVAAATIPPLLPSNRCRTPSPGRTGANRTRTD